MKHVIDSVRMTLTSKTFQGFNAEDDEQNLVDSGTLEDEDVKAESSTIRSEQSDQWMFCMRNMFTAEMRVNYIYCL